MAFVAVACFIVRRHRRRFSRHEVTATKVDYLNSPSEQENVGRLVDVGSGRSEIYRVGLHCATQSEETFVQEPPSAYIPHWRGLPWRSKTIRGMLGECGGSPAYCIAKQVSGPRVERGDWPTRRWRFYTILWG